MVPGSLFILHSYLQSEAMLLVLVSFLIGNPTCGAMHRTWCMGSLLVSSPDTWILSRIHFGTIRDFLPSVVNLLYIFLFCFSLRPEFILNPSEARGLGRLEFTPFFRGG